MSSEKIMSLQVSLNSRSRLDISHFSGTGLEKELDWKRTRRTLSRSAVFETEWQ